MDSEWVVTVVAMGVLLLSVAGSMTRAGRRARAWQDGVEVRWGEVAGRLGGRLEVSARGSLTPRRLKIVVEREDVVAAVEANVPVDPGAPSHTRARARFALGAGPVFRVRERARIDPPGPALPDLVDPDFDRRVWIETDQEAATAALFSAAARAHLAGFGRNIELRSDARSVELVWEGVELEHSTLEHAMGLVAELAQSGVGAVRALSALEGAVYVPVAEGGPLVRLHRGHVEVELSAELSETGPRVCARAATRRVVPAFDIAVAPGGELRGELPAGVVDPDAAPLLARVGECVLKGAPERIELTWASAPRPEQAEAGARIVAGVAAGPGRGGAFR